MDNIISGLFLLRRTDSDEFGGPIIRVVGRAKPDTSYDENVVLMDCGPFWSRLGIVWPQCQSIWLVKDICGLICAIFTWFLIAYAEYVVIFVILLPSPNQIHSIINGTIFQFFAFLAISSHLKAMLSDPVST